MQKRLIALAIAGLVSAPVFAQSTVQVYGIVDEAIDVGNYGAGSVTRLTGSGYNTERLGFQGSEDLGNGMKANFRLELGQRTDVGMLDNTNNQLFQREATLGLSGSWGQVRAGRTYSPLFIDIQAANDLYYVAGIGSNYQLTNTGMTRVNNAVKYDSNSINGFTVGVMYGLGDGGNAAGGGALAGTNGTNAQASGFQEATQDPKDQGRHTGLSLRYNNGPLFVGYGYGNQKSIGVVAPATVVATKASMLTGSYDFKVVKVQAGWQTVNNDANPKTLDQRMWNLGARMPVFGNDTLKLQYTRLTNKLVTNVDSRLISLGYEHPMSKRTTLYGTWAKMTNDSGFVGRTLFGAPTMVVNASGAAMGPGYDPSAFQFGVSHKF